MTLAEYWNGDEAKLCKVLQWKVIGILGIEKWKEVVFELLTRGRHARLVDSTSKEGRVWEQGILNDGFRCWATRV